MKKRIFSQSIAGAILIGTSCIGFAKSAVLWNIDSIRLDISGFMSAGASTTDAENIDFYDPLTKAKLSTVPTIADIGQNVILQPDTMGGMKFDAVINNRFLFGVQFFVVGEDNYIVKTDWLYAKWLVTPNVDISVGRMRLPFYLFSEYSNVAYTYLWTRLPLEVYKIHNFTDFEGLQIQFQNLLGGGWQATETVTVGNTQYPYQLAGLNVPVQLNNAVFANITLDNEILKLNAGYAAGAQEIGTGTELNTIQTALQNPCGFFNPLIPAEIIAPSGTTPGTCFLEIQTPFPVPIGANLAVPDLTTAQLFTVKNVRTQILTLGYDFQWHYLLSNAEWTRTYSDDILLPDSEGWYVTLGLTWQRFTPYVTYADYRTLNNNDRILSNTLSGTFVNPYSYYAPVPLPQPETLQESVNDFLALVNVAQSTIYTGIRYDIWPATAIKIEYRYVIPRDGTAGFFDYSPGKRISWVTAALNVVF